MSTVLTVGALVLGLLGFLTGALALRTLGRLRRSVGVLNRGRAGPAESFLETAARQAETTERTRRDLDDLRHRVDTGLDGMRTEATRSVQRVALVRFDGFDDQSGRLSFSLALLDGSGDGITLTALTGRSDTRLYAKPITQGNSTVDLSPEERQAVTAALSADRSR